MTLVIEGERGTITVPEDVLLAIVAQAASRVEGIRLRRRRTIDVEARTVRISITARRSEPILELGTKTQEAVAAAISAMCGFEPSVDVAIRELA